MIADARKEMADKDAEYTNKIVTNINKIIASIAKTGKYTVIFGKTEGSILYSKEGIDLTASVIKKLDTK
jgi:Skp family chaperone for outer membrane proteins